MPYESEITGYLVTSSSLFKLGGSTGAGTPIWINQFPAVSDDTALAVFGSGGPGPLYTQEGVAVERPTVQVISRSTSYAVARQNADRVWRTLSAVTNTLVSKTTSTGDTTYLTITPLQSPTKMGDDADLRPMVTCNYMAEKELS